MADKVLDAEDGKLRSNVMSRIVQALHRMANRATVQRVGFGVGVWRVLTDD
jgi:hypothetical protein